VIDTTERLIHAAATRILGDKPATFEGKEMSFAVPFKRVRMVDAISNALRSRPGSQFQERFLSDPALLADYVRSDAYRSTCGGTVDFSSYASLSYGKTIAQLFSDFAEGSIWDPTFVIDHPVEISPLSKRRTDDPQVADRFELFAAGMEIANGFSELNDALDQRGRFLDQLKSREKGDAEAHQMDDDYVRALGHGMPPTGGCGVGIDRLAMLLTGQRSIRDVILFPHMRPEAGR
jgi:lysyl-tRNA synthetase class 2